MIYLRVLSVFIFAFILGSIPMAYIIVKTITGEDITEKGSRNCGATNARRVINMYYGKETKTGGIVFYTVIILDALKGIIPVVIAMKLFRSNNSRIVTDGISLCTAVFAVLGHDFMPLFKKGSGKGVSTSAGAFLILAPIPFLIAITFFLLMRLYTKTVSRRVLISAITIPIACIATGVSLPITFASIFLVALLILRHKDNITRIVQGRE